MAVGWSARHLDGHRSPSSRTIIWPCETPERPTLTGAGNLDGLNGSEPVVPDTRQTARSLEGTRPMA